MQYINRNRLNANGVRITPGKRWFTAAEKRRVEIIGLRRKPHKDEFKDTYKTDKVKEALKELFYNQCAYCGCTLLHKRTEVDHFRPKGKVEESPNHTGYYWLTYTWENLYPSCTICNQDKKRAHFPLASEAERAMDKSADLTKEQPLIMDPCKDDPKIYIKYNMHGEPIAIKGNIKGDRSIEVYGLGIEELNVVRRSRIDVMKIYLASCNGDEKKIEQQRNIVKDLFKEFYQLIDQFFDTPYEFGK